MTSLQGYRKFKNDYSASEKTSLLKSSSSNQTSIYAFGNSNLSTEDYGNDNITLRSRNSGLKLNNSVQDLKPNDGIVYVTKEVLPNDTLQSFSLTFRCSINDIKRANGFISDQDFYAVKSIKIPVKEHSLLTDNSEMTHKPASTNLGGSPSMQPATSKKNSDILQPLKFSENIDTETENNLLIDITETKRNKEPNKSVDLQSSSESINLIINEKTNAQEKNDVSGFLKNVDKDIRKTVRKADMKPSSSSNSALDELHLQLPSISSVNYQPIHRGKKTLDGADCGIKWWSIILIFVFFLIFFGILAVYEYKQNEEYRKNAGPHP